MTEISNSLDKINNDETADLMKEFLVELKRGIDERQRFLAQRFEQIDKSFQNIQDTTDKQLTGSEIKELFENNFNIKSPPKYLVIIIFYTYV